VPKKEVDRIFDLDEQTYMGLMAFSRKIGKAIERAVPCKRVGMTIIGLEVPHVHIHLIPLHTMANATFQHKERLTPQVFEAVASSIREQLAKSG